MTIRLLSHTLTILLAVSYLTLATVAPPTAGRLAPIYAMIALPLVALNLRTEGHGRSH